MSDIREEFINKLPFKVLHVDKCDNDDIIAHIINFKQTEDLYLIISMTKTLYNYNIIIMYINLVHY